MKSSLSTLALFLLFGTQLNGQTEFIAHQSHSGSRAQFKRALANPSFDDGSSFGLPVRPITIRPLHSQSDNLIKRISLDSVIFISHREAVMVCSWEDEKNRSHGWFAPGRTHHYEDSLLSKKHSLDSIKQVLKTTHKWGDKIDKTVFVGYDNKTRKYKKQKRKEESPIGFAFSGNGPSSGALVALAFGLSVIFSLASRFRNGLVIKRIPQ